jgi:hypothetical protein
MNHIVILSLKVMKIKGANTYKIFVTVSSI